MANWAYWMVVATFASVFLGLAGLIVIYLWGTIRYIDAFKSPHTTKFRMVYKHGRVGQFAHCEGGNESDQPS